MPKPSISEKYTISHIHQTILSSTSEEDAATRLGTDTASLRRNIANIATSPLTPCTYDLMRNISISQAVQMWGETYYHNMTPLSTDLNHIDLVTIHENILQSETNSRAASKLGVSLVTLKKHLSNFCFFNTDSNQYELLTIETLCGTTISQAVQKWGPRYEQLRIVEKVNFKKQTVADIHQIIKNFSATDAAAQFGISTDTLNKHLEKFSYTDADGKTVNLNFKTMKAMSVEEAKARWGKHYNQPMQVNKIINHNQVGGYLHNPIKDFKAAKETAPVTDAAHCETTESTKINFKDLSLATIHNEIINNSDKNDAAAKLGVSFSTLNRSLKKIQSSLTYGVMKKMTVEAAEKQWGELYHKKTGEILPNKAQGLEAKLANIASSAASSQLNQLGLFSAPAAIAQPTEVMQTQGPFKRRRL